MLTMLMQPAVGTGYTWTQTKTELTIVVKLPAGRGARDITCTTTGGNVDIRLRDGQRLVSGELWRDVVHSSTVWSVESDKLSLELEKAGARFWPCALRGDPEVDVAALLAQEKKDKEPAYKPHPGSVAPAEPAARSRAAARWMSCDKRLRCLRLCRSPMICVLRDSVACARVPLSDHENTPRQVTDQSALRELKAEFPQLAVPLDMDNIHTATHRNHAGPRRVFDWGPIPVEEPPPSAAPAARAEPGPSVDVSDHALEPASRPPLPPAPQVATPAGDNSKFTWGALPSQPSAPQPPQPPPPPPPPSESSTTHAPSGLAAGGGSKYAWGALPTEPLPTVDALAIDAAETAPAVPPPPVATAATTASGDGRGDAMYQWGALPTK